MFGMASALKLALPVGVVTEDHPCKCEEPQNPVSGAVQVPVVAAWRGTMTKLRKARGRRGAFMAKFWG